MAFRTALAHPVRLSALAALLASVLAFGVLAATANVQHRSSLLAQLQRPATLATATIGPGPATAVVHQGRYQLRVTVGPNRAALRDRLAIAVLRDGRPLSGAQVTVSFGMPAMNMSQAFTSRLAPAREGNYAATEPVLGMPGVWQLHLTVVTHDGASLRATVDDQMRS